MKVIKTMHFGNDPQDGEVLNYVNGYAALHPGISAKSLMRNLLLRLLPEEIKREKAAKEAKANVA